MSTLELQSVGKSYGSLPAVVRDVSLALAQGEFCVFVGPSGCGKSSLLRMLAGLEDISEGELRIDGQRMNEAPPARRGVAMVFQNYALFPHMTVAENIGFGLSIQGMPRAEMAARVRKAASVLQLDQLLDRKPKQLSGGQRQRVAIGRAIVREPGVFLFDEPLSNLDASLRVQTRLEIARIHRDYGRACTVYVTHDQVEAMTLADRILLLNTGRDIDQDGSVAQFGLPMELYHRPRTRYVAGFIGSPRMNFMPGVLHSAAPGLAVVQLPDGSQLQACVDAQSLQPGEPVTLGVRPEHMRLGTEGQCIRRALQWQERLGEMTYLYFEATASDTDPLTVKADGQTDLSPNSQHSVELPPQAMHLFDQRGRALPRSVELPV